MTTNLTAEPIAEAGNEPHQIVVSGLRVDVVRKHIKNLHLGVYPPLGRVRVAAPLQVSDDAVRLAILGKLGWIRRQQAGFKAQPRQSRREMVSGESHYFLGQRYRIRIVPHDGPGKVALKSKTIMELHLRPGTTIEQRDRVLQAWYRRQLQDLIPPMLEYWQPIVGATAATWEIRRMKTCWGTCNPDTRHIRINLELAKKPAQCLEYVLVHELVHLHERRHDERFVALLDKHFPHWRQHRELLNAAPLAHEDWTY